MRWAPQVKTTAPKQYAPSLETARYTFIDICTLDTVSVRTLEELSRERRLRLLVCYILPNSCMFAFASVLINPQFSSKQ